MQFLTEKKRSSSFQQLTEKLSPNSSVKTIWQHIRVLTSTYTPFNLKLIKSHNVSITDPAAIASTFAEHYSNQSDTSNFHALFISNFTFAESIQCAENKCSKALALENYNFNIRELEECLNTLSGTTPGVDKITYQMIKNAPIIFKQRIIDLYNNIFLTGTIPEIFKTALIVPIKKSDKPLDEITSYRPISLLPCLSKVLEKLITKQKD